MEGMPRITMIAPDMKVANRPLPQSFEDKIREYIVTHYQDDPSKFDESFKEIASMRNMIMRGSVDVEFICVMKRYYSQLLGIKKRFPMETGDPLALPFSWADRALDLPTSLVYEDINFELCCIMFNIGAAHALIAANESRNDLNSIKNSFTHFQCAAYPFQYLRDHMSCSKYSALDFESSFLTFYLNVMLAQAQECLLEKSIIDQRKPLVIARIAFYLRDVYKQCIYHLENSGISELISSIKFRTFIRLCSAKSELYGAIGNFYMGHKAEDEKNMGLRLAYFVQALNQIKSACRVAEKEHKSNLKEAVNFAFDVIFQREANARKENDFIYHERVTKPEDLEKVEGPISGVVMVKPIAFDPLDSFVAGEDLFKILLPTDVIKAISLYSEEKANFKREIFADVEAKDNQLDNYLVSLQLDQLHLDEPIDQMRLPEELLQSSAAFSAQPDSFPDLLKKFDKVMSMSSQAEDKLSDLRQRLRKVEDAKLQQDEGFKAINTKLEELTFHHVKARSNNAELQRAMASHSENLKLLAMPLAELSRQICGQFIDPLETAEGSILRKMLDKVDEMRKQRCNLMNKFNEDLENDDIARKALAERDLDPKKLFEKELGKHSKTINLIKQNMTAQESILKALTEANADFAEFRRQIVESNEQRALQSLTIVTAFQVFMDVTDKTDKALKFYSQLFSFISAISKGIEHIETTQLDKKREAEKIENEKRAAKEAADTIKDFSLGLSQPHSRTVPRTREISFSPAPQSSVATGNRPRLGDYMNYYRNKMGPVASSVPTAQQQQPQMHSPIHPYGNYPSNHGVINQPPVSYPPNTSFSNARAYVTQNFNSNPSNIATSHPSLNCLYSPVNTHEPQMAAPNTHNQYVPRGKASYVNPPGIPQHYRYQSEQYTPPTKALQTDDIPQPYSLTSSKATLHEQLIPQYSNNKCYVAPTVPPQPQKNLSQHQTISFTPASIALEGTAVFREAEGQKLLSQALVAEMAEECRTSSASQPTHISTEVTAPQQTESVPPATQHYIAANQIMNKTIPHFSGAAAPQPAVVSIASPWHQNLSKHNPYAPRQLPISSLQNTKNASNIASSASLELGVIQPSYFASQTPQNTIFYGVTPQPAKQQHNIEQNTFSKSSNTMASFESYS